MILKDMGNETGKKLEKAAMGKFKVERSCVRCKVVINTNGQGDALQPPSQGVASGKTHYW